MTAVLAYATFILGFSAFLGALAFAVWWVLKPREDHKQPYDNWPKGTADTWPTTEKNK